MLFVAALEAQVETEHEERTHLVREKHELERRLLELMDRSSVAPDDDTVHRWTTTQAEGIHAQTMCFLDHFIGSYSLLVLCISYPDSHRYAKYVLITVI